MTKRVSGKDFHINIGGYMVKVESCSLSIEDSRTVVKTQGVPNGYVDGEVSAQGELTVDTQNLQTLIQMARSAKSFRGMPTFDMNMTAEADVGLNVEAFGVLLKVNELLDIDTKGAEKSVHKLTYDVTSPDFVKINGVPYLDNSELLGVAQ